jgi:hypothetical protein
VLSVSRCCGYVKMDCAYYTFVEGIWYTVLSHKDCTSLSHKSGGFYFILKFVISGYLHMWLLQRAVVFYTGGW